MDILDILKRYFFFALSFITLTHYYIKLQTISFSFNIQNACLKRPCFGEFRYGGQFFL